MTRLIALALLLHGVAAKSKMPHWVTEEKMCARGSCDTPDMPYEYVADVQPGYQWNDAGGYCGSWATQRAVLAQGAWISQQ